MTQQDDFLSNYGESVVNWSKPRKIAGMYKAKDVDSSVENMQKAFANMQESYQERFEEQRLSLLAISRERDELGRANAELSAEINSVEELKRQIEVFEQKNEQMQEKISLLEQEKKDANELEDQLRQVSASLEKSNSEITRVEDELQNQASNHARELAAAEAKLDELSGELQLRSERIEQLSTDLQAEADDKAIQIKNRNEQIRLMRDRYQMAMHDHVDALRNMSDAYKRHAESIFDLDNSAIEKFGV